MTFGQLGIDIALAKKLQEKGLTPTSFQEVVLPIFLEEKNFLSYAPSKKGKSVAFFLGFLQHFFLYKEKAQPAILILSEEESLKKLQDFIKEYELSSFLEEFSISIYKEEDRYLYKRSLPRGLILLSRDYLSLEEEAILLSREYTYFYLDEAHLLYEEGFLAYLKGKLRKKKKKKIFLTSGEFSYPVLYYLWDLMEDPEEILFLGDMKLSPEDFPQKVIHLAKEEKLPYMLAYFQKYRYFPLMVYVSHVKLFPLIENNFSYHNIPAKQWNRRLSSLERRHILEGLQKGRIQAIISTEEESRGLPWDSFRMVLNYDFPSNIEQYIKRAYRIISHPQPEGVLTICSEVEYTDLERLESALGYSLKVEEVEEEIIENMAFMRILKRPISKKETPGKKSISRSPSRKAPSSDRRRSSPREKRKKLPSSPAKKKLSLLEKIKSLFQKKKKKPTPPPRRRSSPPRRKTSSRRR